MSMLNKLFYLLYDGHKKTKTLLGIIAICIILVLLGSITTWKMVSNYIFFDIIVFPFTLVAALLKWIALLGVIGNFISILLLLLISGSPILIYLIYVIKHKDRITRFIFHLIFYIVLSILIGITLYLNINPSLIRAYQLVVPNDPISLIPLVNTTQDNTQLADYQEYLNLFHKVFLYGLGSSVFFLYFIYIGYGFYRYTKTNKLNLFQASNSLLILLKIAYVTLFVVAFYFCPVIIKMNLKDSDTFFANTLVFLTYLYTYLTLFLFLLIFRKLHDLLKNFKNELLFDEQNILYLRKISHLFILLLITNLIFQFVYNISTLINSSKLQNFNISYSYPTTQIILALAFYLLSLVLNQSYKIYKENSLTI